MPEILDAIVERIPAPEGDPEAPLQALIFDSVFNPFRGIIAYFKIENGTIRKNDFVKFVATGKEYHADEIGVLKLDMSPCDVLSAGNVGYIISGIKTSREVKVGDTITHVSSPCKEAIDGFEEVKPMVFAGVYPIETEDFENLRASLEKLQLNDASLTFQPNRLLLSDLDSDADSLACFIWRLFRNVWDENLIWMLLPRCRTCRIVCMTSVAP